MGIGVLICFRVLGVGPLATVGWGREEVRNEVLGFFGR